MYQEWSVKVLEAKLSDSKICTCSYCLTGQLTSVSTMADILDKGSGAVLLIDGEKFYNFLRGWNEIWEAYFLAVRVSASLSSVKTFIFLSSIESREMS